MSLILVDQKVTITTEDGRQVAGIITKVDGDQILIVVESLLDGRCQNNYRQLQAAIKESEGRIDPG